MTHTVNLLYYKRQEMAESPKRSAEFGIPTKRFNRVRKMFWRPKREAEFGNGNLPAEPFKVAVLPVLQQFVVEHGPGASRQDSQHLPCQTKSKSKPSWNSNTMPGVTVYHKVDRVLGLFSNCMNWVPPPPQPFARVPPPSDSGGKAHSLAAAGVGRGSQSDKGTDTVVL